MIYTKNKILQLQCALFSAYSGDVKVCVNLVHEDGENSFRYIFVIFWPIHTFFASVEHTSTGHIWNMLVCWWRIGTEWYIPKLGFKFLHWQAHLLLSAYGGDVHVCVNSVHVDGENSFRCIFVISLLIYTLLAYVTYVSRTHLAHVGLLVNNVHFFKPLEEV